MNDRPNILFIMSDDHASNAISAYGSKINQTPNIDRLANEGMRFDHCYVTNSICTPSRAAILTGTHNHVNGVTTLITHINNRAPNVAKHLQADGYQTGIFGKWHLGRGKDHEPTGFDSWSVLPGQGQYHTPMFINDDGTQEREEGYVTDLIADKCLNFLEHRDEDKPFFLMCHHKAPHREWDPKPEHRSLYQDDFPLPETLDDDYTNRAQGAKEARMRIAGDMNYSDLDLVQLPEDIGYVNGLESRRRILLPENGEPVTVRCMLTGEATTFTDVGEMREFLYQRYIRKYVQCIHSVDENVGRLLDYLDEHDLTDNTMVIYTSDQGFFLGEHGWYDKRFIYEESFQMPFLLRYPKAVEAGSVNTDMVCNVDFAPTWLELAGAPLPNYMQGRSILPLCKGNTPEDWTDLAYHRYWMNNDNCHHARAHYGIRTHDYKLIYWYYDPLNQPGAREDHLEPEWELFDLNKDPKELINVYSDPAYADIVTEMTAKLDAEMARIGDVPEH